MGLLDRFRIRRSRGSYAASMDREATPADLEALREFTRARTGPDTGVEFYVEPETMVTDTTVVAVATDGEWTRRRVGSPAIARRLAKELQIPVYDVQIVGYPPRMRAWNARMKAEGRSDRLLRSDGSPPVRTQRPPDRTLRPQDRTSRPGPELP